MTLLFAMRKFIRGFGFAAKGVRYAFRSQLNFRVQCLIAVVALVLGIVLHISAAEWCWISLCIGLVLSAELLNTSLEALTDLVSPGFNEKAGIVKDAAAAAVLITAFFSLVIGCIIFLPKLYALICHAA